MNYTHAISPGAMFQKDTSGGHSRPTHEEIQRLAYEFYERRGRGPGNELDDWVAAEKELCLQYWGNTGICVARREQRP